MHEVILPSLPTSGLISIFWSKCYPCPASLFVYILVYIYMLLYLLLITPDESSTDYRI